MGLHDLMKGKAIMLYVLPVILFIALPNITDKGKNDHSSFKLAVHHVLKEEGGLSVDKTDKGGTTKYGISLNFLRDTVRANPSLMKEFCLDKKNIINSYDVQNMTKEEAEYIYKTLWWDRYNYGKINYQPLATKVFDLAVNMGPAKASKLLTKASGLNGYKTTSELNTNVINYINSLPEYKKEEIIRKLKILSLRYYIAIVKKNPSQKKFLKGWTKRAER